MWYDCPLNSHPKHINYEHLQVADRFGGVMDSVFSSSVEGRGFDPVPGQTKDFKIGIAASPLSTQD